MNCTVIDNTDLDNLKNPELETIKVKAEQFDYHLLLKEDRETLEKLAQQPDLDHIKQKSKDLGYIPVKEEEHQNYTVWLTIHQLIILLKSRNITDTSQSKKLNSNH